MNKKATLSLIVVTALISIVACQNRSSKTENTTVDIITPVNKNNSRCDTMIVSDVFGGYEALAFKVFKADSNQIKSLFLDKVVLKMDEEKSSDGSRYFHHFTDGVNAIILLYHPNEGFYLEKADIKNERVLLNKKISFGMTKVDFLKVLKVANIKCDTITITNDESSFENVFIFKDAKLNEIRMGQTVE